MGQGGLSALRHHGACGNAPRGRVEKALCESSNPYRVDAIKRGKRFGVADPGPLLASGRLGAIWHAIKLGPWIGDPAVVVRFRFDKQINLILAVNL